MPRLLEHDISSLYERAQRLEGALRAVIRGSDEVVRLALVAVFARGHLLIEGVPGLGKTLMAYGALPSGKSALHFPDGAVGPDAI